MSDKAVSSNSGLYGESIYPPMFDNEPPPLDDEDGDPSEDDFADFTSFQRTGSDSNNWGSWSNWSGNTGMQTKVGEIDGAFQQASFEIAAQDIKELHRSETKNSPIQSGSSEEVSQFEAFSKYSSSDFVNREVDQKSSLVTDSLNNETDQLHSKLENQDVEKLSCNGSELLEDASNMGFMHKADSLVEEKSDPPDIFEVNFDRSTNISEPSNGIYKDVTQEEMLDEKVANFENEDEFDDFANFKTSTARDGFFVSSFDDEKEFVKNNNLKSFEEYSLKLQNGSMEFEDEVDCTKVDETLGASDIKEMPESFNVDFPPMHNDILVTSSFSTENKDYGQSRDIVKNEILAVSSTDSGSIVSNVHSSLHDKSNFQCDDENQRSNLAAGLETFAINAAPGSKSLNETVANDEKNLSENMIMNQSLSYEENSLSMVENAARDHETLGSSKDTNVDNLDNCKKDIKCINGFENQPDTNKVSKIEVEFLSIKSTYALPQNDVNNEVEFEDFQSTNAFQSISEDENKHAFADYKNAQIDEFNSTDRTDVNDPNSTKMLEETKSSNLDLFAGKESFAQQNHNGIDFKGIDEFEGFQKTKGSDILPSRLESSSKIAVTEMKSNIHDSFNRSRDKTENYVDEFEDFEGFTQSNKFVSKNEAPLDSTDAERSFLDSDPENKNNLSHEDESNDLKICATSVQSIDSENEHKNAISSKELTGDGADPASFPASSSNEETDDFDDFQDFSTATDDSLKKDAEDMSKLKAESGWGNSTESNKEDKEEDKWASFSSAEQSIQSNTASDSTFGSFAAFPANEQQENVDNDDDDNWASFSSPQSDNSFQHLPSVTRKEFVPENEFGSTSRQVGVMQSNVLVTKVVGSPSQKMPCGSAVSLLLAPCFPKRENIGLGSVTLFKLSNVEKILHDERDQDFSGVWSRLSDSDALEETWKLSYTSSDNFKWLLQSVNVTFEKIMIKHTHSSKDTLSSLSPASSVASFDMENFGEQILIPEPATRFSSLLKPTLLAQSQQKELDLQSVPPVSYLKKGDSGSDSTSETNSLDLEFFSGGSSVAPASINSTGSSSSLSNIELRDIELTTESSTMQADTQDKKQFYLPPRSSKGSSSLPFNLGSMTNAAGKEDISIEARRFLEDVESLRFMSSTVLMFPSQFSNSE